MVYLHLEPITVNEAKDYLVKYLGEAFIKGISINVAKGYGVCLVKTDEGEREMKISIPRMLVSQ